MSNIFVNKGDDQFCNMFAKDAPLMSISDALAQAQV